MCLSPYPNPFILVRGKGCINYLPLLLYVIHEQAFRQDNIRQYDEREREKEIVVCVCVCSQSNPHNYNQNVILV